MNEYQHRALADVLSSFTVVKLDQLAHRMQITAESLENVSTSKRVPTVHASGRGSGSTAASRIGRGARTSARRRKGT